MSLAYVLPEVLSLLQTELDLDSTRIRIMRDSRPPAFSGEFFYSIYGKTQVTPGGAGEGAIMEVYSFTVAVTQRSTIVPTDEQGLRTLISHDFPTTLDINQAVEVTTPINEKMRGVVAAIVANADTLLNNINTRCSDAGEHACIHIPELEFWKDPTEVGPDHFWSGDMDHPVVEQTKGFVGEVVFSLIQRPLIFAGYN